MIEGIKIVKRFQSLTLFDGLDFSINDGEFVCFSGESGKGKTTLLNMIGLIEPISDGELTINGLSHFSNRQKREYYRSQVGFLFQNFALVDHKSVRENLEIVTKKTERRIRWKKHLERVGLADKINNKVYTLSGGKQQRHAWPDCFSKNAYRACDSLPGLWIGKRSTGDGNPARFKQGGKTVIMVSHDEKVKNPQEGLLSWYENSVYI